jgi:hypothetical protein
MEYSRNIEVKPQGGVAGGCKLQAFAALELLARKHVRNKIREHIARGEILG